MMSFPDLTRIINNVQRSNLKYKDIVESAVIDYYKKLGQAAAIKEATKEPIPVEPSPGKPLSRMNKVELLAKCAELGVADQVKQDMSNKQLIGLISKRG